MKKGMIYKGNYAAWLTISVTFAKTDLSTENLVDMQSFRKS